MKIITKQGEWVIVDAKKAKELIGEKTRWVAGNDVCEVFHLISLADLKLRKAVIYPGWISKYYGVLVVEYKIGDPLAGKSPTPQTPADYLRRIIDIYKESYTGELSEAIIDAELFMLEWDKENS